MSYDCAVDPDIQGQPKCVLVVEDDIGLRFTLSEWLRIEGYTVYEAATADEAVIVLASLIKVDIVVTDVDMPGSMDGLGLVDHIRKDVSGVEVVVVSGNSSSKRADVRDVAFFRKPYDLQRISTHIAMTLQTDSGGKGK